MYISFVKAWLATAYSLVWLFEEHLLLPRWLRGRAVLLTNVATGCGSIYGLSVGKHMERQEEMLGEWGYWNVASSNLCGYILPRHGHLVHGLWHCLACLHLGLLPIPASCQCTRWEVAGDGSSRWVPDPHLRDPDWVPVSWFLLAADIFIPVPLHFK